LIKIFMLVILLYVRERKYTIIQGVARNVIPLIVHVTHFYYYKNF